MQADQIVRLNGSPEVSRGYLLLRVFFLVLPFVYLIQVLAGHPAAGLVGYLPLVLLLGGVVARWAEFRDQFVMHPKMLWLLAFGLVVHNALSGFGFLLTGDIGLGGRVLVLFVLPFVIFVHGGKLTHEQQWGLVKVIALTSSIVAAELLWEDICVWWLQESSWFQLLNYRYVLEQTGKDLTQLYLPGYRGTGLLEHVHVSTFFLAIGILAGLAAYLKTGARYCLWVVAFCAFVLVVHGIRFALLAGGGAVVLQFLLFRYVLQGGERRRFRVAALVLASVVLAALLLDPFGTVRRFYIPVVAHGAWNLDRPDDFTPGSVIHNGVGIARQTLLSRLEGGVLSLDFFMAWFGHGISQSLAGNVEGLDDDFFVAQIFAQYGILGGGAFYVFFVTAIVQGGRALRSVRQEEAILLSFAMAMVMLLVVSTFHSGVIQRKVMFALMLWGMAIIYSFSVSCRALTGRPKD